MALLSLSQHAVIKCFSLHFITTPKFHFVVQSQRFPKRKDSRGFFKRTNKVHKFKGCFLRRREKKKRIFCFQKAQQMCHQAGSRCFLTASCLLILVRKWGIAIKTGAPNGNFRENICSEDDLRTRIFGTFVVKFLACLPLLRFSNIYKMV